MIGDTQQQIIAIATELVRQRGYGGFSYADISDRVGIRKASIHYHFPSKEELVKQLVTSYRETFARERQHIDKSGDTPAAKLRLFADLYRDGLHYNCLCLCAMLAADYATLPESVCQEVELFFNENETWLACVLKEGSRSGTLTCRGSANLEAKTLVSLLQGAQLRARASGEGATAFEAIARNAFGYYGIAATPA